LSAAVLDADSFLIKGSDVPAGSRYGGNPAHEVRALQAGPTGRESTTTPP
jgi:hypothetical protein